MARQLRFRFPRPKTELSPAYWAIFESGGQPPFAVAEIDERGRVINRPGRGIFYSNSLDLARRSLPGNLLRLDAPSGEIDCVKKIPTALGRLLEVWF